MYKQTWICVLVLLVFTVQNSFSDTLKDSSVPKVMPKVMIGPFTIHAVKDKDKLQQKIDESLSTLLREKGVILIPAKKDSFLILQQSTQKDKPILEMDMIEQLKKNFRMYGTDYLIWGSLSWIGNRISLDCKLLPIESEEGVELFFVEGDTLEKLDEMIQKAVNHFGLVLFKQERITAINIIGNNRIETDAIRKVIQIQLGDLYLPERLTEVLKAIYKMGYFDHVEFQIEPDPKTDGSGKKLIVQIKEKSSIRKILFKGNKSIDEDDLKESMQVDYDKVLIMTASGRM
ncbi:MAG: hypothetical protein HQK77_21250, partial [Desulfobacterales bacterium]|nr:hypothetical protein [Desulfobacterales bacterium]